MGRLESKENMKQEFNKLQVFTDKKVRWGSYPMFLKLMEKDCEIEAFMFILSTWNFARFRYAMRDFDLETFIKEVKKLAPLFQKIQKEDFKSISFDKYSLEIKQIFNVLANIKGIEKTGASKLMHLKLPGVFVMWDGYIRKAYGYNTGNADEYISFLKKMQKMFSKTKIKSDRTLAKLIDEHNYKKFTMPALAKVREKRQKP